ncbi:MAG: T9SS type A sorting domain-containing protein, partial [Flavobacteriales bacterium]|nr:T9SS type A sorting domain-containing protein [Flavobacteriales bacterium]
IVTLDLTINTVDNSVTETGSVLTANQAGAAYVWLDCDDSFAVISGQTNQIFTAPVNGNYAVIINYNGCLDTSACYLLTGVGLIESNFDNKLLLYPNPTDGDFSIDLGDNYSTVTITITDLNGKLIQSNKYYNSQLLNLKLEEPAGVYILMIKSDEKNAVIRLVKE